MIVPAVALGAFVVFGAGWVLTTWVLTQGARRTRPVPAKWSRPMPIEGKQR
jgi:hypothetical protein